MGGTRTRTHRFVPTASISSMNTIDGASSSATRNNSRTSFGPAAAAASAAARSIGRSKRRARAYAHTHTQMYTHRPRCPAAGAAHRRRGTSGSAPTPRHARTWRSSGSPPPSPAASSRCLPPHVRTMSAHVRRALGRRTWHAVQDDALGRLDPNVLVQFRVRHGELNRLRARRKAPREHPPPTRHCHARTSLISWICFSSPPTSA